MTAVTVWCAVQLAIFWLLTRFCRTVLRFEPSETLFTAPHRVLGLSLVHVAIVAGSAWLLDRVPGVEPLTRPVWFSRGGAGTLAVCVLLGLVPAVVNVAGVALSRRGRFAPRPTGGAYPVGALGALVIGLAAHAFIEELVFRNVPLALARAEDVLVAFAVPVTAFVLIHFLEPGRPRSAARIAHLATGALFFFVVAWRFGLLHATAAHAAANLSTALTEGSWSVGALVACTGDEPDARFLRNSLGYLVSATVLLTVYGL